jgi:hypothetical protein
LILILKTKISVFNHVSRDDKAWKRLILKIHACKNEHFWRKATTTLNYYLIYIFTSF